VRKRAIDSGPTDVSWKSQTYRGEETMPFLFNTPEDQRAMLDAIGVASLDELFQSIPRELRLQRPLDLRRR